jgi:hypothetical protein
MAVSDADLAASMHIVYCLCATSTAVLCAACLCVLQYGITVRAAPYFVNH